MNSYSTTWNENTETLTIDSTWDASANINRIAFLISDGGSPWLTPNEQFLWHDLDLTTGVMTVSNYFGPRPSPGIYRSCARCNDYSVKR